MTHWTFKATDTQSLIKVYWTIKAREEISEIEKNCMDQIKTELAARGYEFGILTQEIIPVWNDNHQQYNVVIRYQDLWQEVRRGLGSYLHAFNYGLKRLEFLNGQ